MTAGPGAAGPEVIVPVVGKVLGGRRRRPSGEPPPLPWKLPASTVWYATVIVFAVALEFVLAAPALRPAVTRLDDGTLRLLGHLRTGVATWCALLVEKLGTQQCIQVLGWSTIAVLLAWRRLRRLFVYLTVLLVVVSVSTALATAQGRMRTGAVELIGPWQGYAHPAAPVAMFAAVVVGAVANLVPNGRFRSRVRAVGAALVLLLTGARLYLGVDRPTDAFVALALGGALSVIAYRLAVPEEAFAIGYRRHRTAHLDITPARHAAVLAALADQLGIPAESVEPFGLAASAGSTPLRITTRDGAALFGKLYAVNHLRADRSYKLARMVLYGRLEDEKPFASVRRLVEYEDHLLRLLRDNGLPVPQPLGFVEITPEREYVLVMSFVSGARDLGDEPIGDQQIDEALGIVRALWRAGVAHRDIKPSNLLLAGGHVRLIDVAFAAVRPTPWRQAVDLANMMLTLALVSDPEHVYRRAVRQLAPEDIAEAFAACRSITIPTQLRGRLHADQRDLIGAFRGLAPEREPVRIQVWSLRRLGTTVGALLLLGLAAAAVYAYARTAGLL